MAGIVYYNKMIKIIDRILVIAIIASVLVWVTTKRSVSPIILLAVGLQQLLYALNSYQLKQKRQMKISLALGLVMTIPAIMMILQ